MKKVYRLFALIFCLVVILSMSSCNSLKITEEMQAAIDMYISAVEKSMKRTEGEMTVTSKLDDSAVEFKTTESVIEYSFNVENEKVIYERVDKLNGQENAKYKCDGTKVEAYNFETQTWEDKTEANEAFLKVDTNPLVSLSLFRVDSNLKVRTDYMTDIKSYSEDDFTVVEFTLDDSTVSDILQYSKADGIVRKSAGHTRSYYIDENGYISKIIVSTVQLFYSNGEEGVYTTEMTVLCK